MLAPMISCPLKQTNEIDWVTPLKLYIRQSYGDDPERYAEECATLNRLRQDMRGAGKDSASGRDLLYRYYGQLELLDLRFPVDENHIKISFTWFDAFNHKPTAQYSLAYEKASIIFNISAVLSCHAANQNRNEDFGLKTAYHSFQASAGMFTYINENFLHAPSIDLSRETVKTLISIMLAQGQEVFLEKQVADGKKVGLLAKLAAQAAFLYGQALEGVQDNVQKGTFEKVWSLVVQVKFSYMAAVAQYYQALAENDANAHGTAIARLQSAETLVKDASRVAASFPSNIPPISNLSADTGGVLADLTKRHLVSVQEKLTEFLKDNDFIYHQSVPSEASLAPIPKLPAAKAIPVNELYQSQDIQKIIGPDIFQKIVPLAVTESASLYDEEKAKLVRAESERTATADDEMAASLDYLKLPNSLDVLKHGATQEPSVDESFRQWCEDISSHGTLDTAFNQLQSNKGDINSILDDCSKQLDMEESVCEKMRSKYGADWTQQPSSRLTATLRNDIKNYRGALDEAVSSDTQLMNSFRQHRTDFDEMRSAGETGEADVLYQRALIKASASKNPSSPSASLSASINAEGSLLDEDYGEGGPTVAQKISTVEETMRKLQLIKRERAQVLKDLKEKVRNDDISNVLILNKKSISNQENQLFKAELEKFRPYQNRLLQANHKQATLLKELTLTYGELLQDKRVRSEQNKYETVSRQRKHVLTRYHKVHQAFNDLTQGLMRAQGFYSEMMETSESLKKNVDSFVSNRRAEGAQLLGSIETSQSAKTGGRADDDRDQLQNLMQRMSVGGMTSASPPIQQQQTRAPFRPMSYDTSTTQYNTQQYPTQQYNTPPPPPQQQQQYMPPNPPYQAPPPSNGFSPPPRQTSFQREPYNPSTYGHISPPPQQTTFPPPMNQYGSPPMQPHQPQNIPTGYVPPPPPPGPPPAQQDYSAMMSTNYPSGPGGYAQPRSPPPKHQQQQQNQSSGDPWAGLNSWK